MRTRPRLPHRPGRRQPVAGRPGRDPPGAPAACAVLLTRPPRRLGRRRAAVRGQLPAYDRPTGGVGYTGVLSPCSARPPDRHGRWRPVVFAVLITGGESLEREGVRADPLNAVIQAVLDRRRGARRPRSGRGANGERAGLGRLLGGRAGRRAAPRPAGRRRRVGRAARRAQRHAQPRARRHMALGRLQRRGGLASRRSRRSVCSPAPIVRCPRRAAVRRAGAGAPRRPGGRRLRPVPRWRRAGDLPLPDHLRQPARRSTRSAVSAVPGSGGSRSSARCCSASR